MNGVESYRCVSQVTYATHLILSVPSVPGTRDLVLVVLKHFEDSAVYGRVGCQQDPQQNMCICRRVPFWTEPVTHIWADISTCYDPLFGWRDVARISLTQIGTCTQ